MARKMLIAAAAIATVTAMSTLPASAMHGMFGHGFAARSFGFHEQHRFGFHHFPFFRDRFAFYGVGYPYRYYDDCYAPVRTPWGWRWRYVCY